MAKLRFRSHLTPPPEDASFEDVLLFLRARFDELDEALYCEKQRATTAETALEKTRRVDAEDIASIDEALELGNITERDGNGEYIAIEDRIATLIAQRDAATVMARAEEREACAKIADAHAPDAEPCICDGINCGLIIAKDIRARDPDPAGFYNCWPDMNLPVLDSKKVVE